MQYPVRREGVAAVGLPANLVPTLAHLIRFRAGGVLRFPDCFPYVGRRSLGLLRRPSPRGAAPTTPDATPGRLDPAAPERLLAPYQPIVLGQAMYGDNLGRNQKPIGSQRRRPGDIIGFAATLASLRLSQFGNLRSSAQIKNLEIKGELYHPKKAPLPYGDSIFVTQLKVYLVGHYYFRI
jgi:hypothetical protein